MIHSHDTQAVSAQVTEEEGKLQKLRIQLAKRNRDIAALQRKIDNIPTRGELAQYQQVRAVVFLAIYRQGNWLSQP